MDVFQFNDFRDLLRAFLKTLPNNGFGYNKKMAAAAGISTAFLSQVFSQKRQLSLEQASLIADFLGFQELQTEYFLALVQLDRSGNHSLRTRIHKQLERIRSQAKAVSKRFAKSNEVSESEKPLYYSDWTYIAVQQLTAIAASRNEMQIAEKLQLPLKRVREIMAFLIRTGLCVEEKGKINVGPARIHLSPDSPWIKQHHSNWRLHALRAVENEDPVKLHYSSPMTLSVKDYEKVRSILVAAIAEVAKVVDPSPSEELACLNIDWFKVAPEKRRS